MGMGTDDILYHSTMGYTHLLVIVFPSLFALVALVQATAATDRNVTLCYNTQVVNVSFGCGDGAGCGVGVTACCLEEHTATETVGHCSTGNFSYEGKPFSGLVVLPVTNTSTTVSAVFLSSACPVTSANIGAHSLPCAAGTCCPLDWGLPGLIGGDMVNPLGSERRTISASSSPSLYELLARPAD